jgi:antitoxin (DNA-binding transcriptional repressor) of toxin-antitoxin stability system
MIQIDARDQTLLSAALALLTENHEDVMIRQNGEIVAKLVGMKSRAANRFAQDPALAVVFHENPMTPLPDEEWQEEPD